jgi:hypothetical protein
LRNFAISAFLIFILSGAALSQAVFYENGQSTRSGPDAGLFPDTPSRQKIDLAGTWKYTLDGKEWLNVSVPAAYDGPRKITFMRSFEIKSEMLDKYAFSLVMYGINYQSEITINGNFVARHQGGYTSVTIPIQPGTLQLGSDNSIVITVDNALNPRTTLPLREEVGGWRNYGGIFRDIYILATPKLYIEHAEAKTSVAGDASAATVSVSADILDRWSGQKNTADQSFGFQVEVYDKIKGDFVARSGIAPLTSQVNKSVAVIAQAVIPSPKLWSPEFPDLYVVKCEIVRMVDKEVNVFDEYDFDAGIRTLTWKDGHLVVNTVNEPLRGVIWHEDHPLLASAMSYELMEKDIALIKSLGANLVRFPCPPHPYLLNLCDRYGLLATEEIPVVNVPSEILMKDYYQDLAVTYAKEMIARDRNHASILAWGIGEGFEYQTAQAAEYVTSMRGVIKGLDERPVYYLASSADEPLLENVDLVVLTSRGQDPKEIADLLKACQTKYPGKPVILGSYGKNVEEDNRKGYSDPRSLESQARYIMRVFESARDEHIAGSVICAFSDWKTDRPSMVTNSSDPYIQSMGIVSYEREKRVAFDVVRALYNGEKVQALPVGNYSASAPIIFVFAEFVVFLSLAFYYNANRRFHDCVTRGMMHSYNFFADVRDQRILTYPMNLFLTAVVAFTLSTTLSSILSHYRYSLLLDDILSQFLSDGIKSRFIELIWSPAKFIAVMGGVIAGLILLTAFVVKLCSYAVRTHVYFYHALSITAWAFLPYIVIIPLAMICYRLMEIEMYIIPIFVILAAVKLWSAVRLLKGVSIIYDVPPVQVYAGGILLILVVFGGIYGYYDYAHSTTMYLKYLLSSSQFNG